MTTLRTAAQQALEALEDWDSPVALPAMVALRAALVEDAMQKFTDVSQEIEAALAEQRLTYMEQKMERSIESLKTALAEPVEPVACSNTFGCQCPKHFASQQLEQRPKRVLTAVWRDRARRAEAQRDALLEVLKELLESAAYWSEYDVPLGIVDRIRAAIKAAEENT